MAHLWVGTTKDNLAEVKCPSSLSWGEIIVSDEDAGRVRKDARMYVNEVAKKVQISLAWNGLRAAEVSKILKAFRHTYFFVKYLDPVENEFTIKEFYHGDFKAPVYSYWDYEVLYQNVAFDIIER